MQTRKLPINYVAWIVLTVWLVIVCTYTYYQYTSVMVFMKGFSNFVVLFTLLPLNMWLFIFVPLLSDPFSYCCCRRSHQTLPNLRIISGLWTSSVPYPFIRYDALNPFKVKLVLTRDRVNPKAFRETGCWSFTFL